MKKTSLILILLSFLVTNCKSSNNNIIEEDILATNISLADQSGEKIPIMAFSGLRSTEATAEMYKDFADAGYSINMGSDLMWYGNAYTYPPSKLFTALDQAVVYGFKQIVSVHWLHTLSAENIAKLKSHPGLAGYHIKDEPLTYQEMNEIKPWVEKVKTLDGVHFPYANLAGADCRGSNWAPELIGCTAVEPSPFTNFVKTYVDEIDVPMVSFDVYPVLYDKTVNRRYLKPGWFYTLEIASKEAKRKNKELWAFALSTTLTGGDLDYPSATIDDLRLQMFVNLAYGAQCLQYYTYYPSDNEEATAQITKEGVKTPTYYVAQEMNKEIDILSPVFLNARMIWVAHTGEIPDGCCELTNSQLPSVFSSLDITGENGALVSLLEKGEDAFLVVLNRNVEGKITVKAKGSKDLYRLNKQVKPVLLGNTAQELDPGNMVIFFWKK